MKLICQPFISNEGALSPELLVLNLNPAEAKRLLDVLCHGREFLQRMHRQGLSGPAEGSVDFASPVSFEVFKAATPPWEAVLEALPTDLWARVPESLQLPGDWNSENHIPTECHKIMVSEDGISIQALHQHCDDRYECAFLSVEVLRNLADGMVPTELDERIHWPEPEIKEVA